MEKPRYIYARNMLKYASLVHSTYIASHKATSQLVNNFIYTSTARMMHKRVLVIQLSYGPTAYDHRTFCCMLTLNGDVTM